MKEQLETLAYLTAILGSIFGALIFVVRCRSASISNLREALANEWTNEGDISQDLSPFVNLKLSIEDGDLFGTIRSSSEDHDLEAHVDVHWGWAKLRVTRLLGRNLFPVATVVLRLTGNRNQLTWLAIRRQEASLFPRRSELWPVPAAARARPNRAYQSGR